MRSCNKDIANKNYLSRYSNDYFDSKNKKKKNSELIEFHPKNFKHFDKFNRIVHIQFHTFQIQINLIKSTFIEERIGKIRIRHIFFFFIQ